MANIYRCVKCKAKLGGFFTQSPYRCKNRACRKTYCYDCCKTGVIFTDTTCPDCGSPTEDFKDNDNEDEEHHRALKSNSKISSYDIADEKYDESEEEEEEEIDVDFDLIFCEAYDEYKADNLKAALQKYKEVARLTNDDDDRQICYEMIAHIHEQKLATFEDLLIALKYFRWSEKIDGFTRVLHKLTTHPQASSHTEALIKHIELFRNTNEREDDWALLHMQLQQLQNHALAHTGSTTGNSRISNNVSSKSVSDPIDAKEHSFATCDSRLLTYISQAIQKGYAPGIFANCLSEQDIVKVMGDFMKKKYLDLGYPKSLFEHCSLPLEVKNAAEKYLHFLEELKSKPQKISQTRNFCLIPSNNKKFNCD